jgi:hypothetical protein
MASFSKTRLLPTLPCTYIYAGLVRCLRGTELSAVTFGQHVHKVKLTGKVTLRLAVYRQSVRLGAKPLEIYYKIFFQLNLCVHRPYETSSLTRGWICLL